MMPEALRALVRELAKLPGIGPRSAERIALHLVTSGDVEAISLSNALKNAAESVGFCRECGALSEKGKLCAVCSDSSRSRKSLMIVEGPLDVFALERGGFFTGVYHVLGGVLSPLEGVTPEDLKIPELIARIRKNGTNEAVVATNPSAEGDVTASYIAAELKPLGVRVTRLARGLPTGAQVDYADSDTLEQALAHRTEL
ncbi:MAG: recombination protein RecR [bacterium]|jgi:recombination protein RecR